ncbi:hypothetical protein Tco_0379611 [Tanacetum coccineum]
MKAALITMGLVNENDPKLSSFELVNSSSLRIRYFLVIWEDEHQPTYDSLWFVLGLDIDIVGILFSDLVTKLTTRKKGRDQNICYTRYSSLIIEHLLGEAYINENLNTIKPYHITSSTFKPSTASEVPLTSYMQKVAKLSEQTEKPLILPSKEVNTDTTIDKSFSRTSIHLGAQSKLQRNNWQEVKEEEKPSFL